MFSTLTAPELVAYLGTQISHLFPDGRHYDLAPVVRTALDRLEHCFSRVSLRGYKRDGAVSFNHLHSDQYATFVYLAANSAWKLQQNTELAAKLYGLNKALNGFMCMYDTELPSQFLIIHTVGMMLGKAAYSDYFVAVHTANIGTDRGKTPRMEEGVIVFGGGAIVGDCNVGREVVVATHSVVRNETIPPRHVAAGVSPRLTLKPASRRLVLDFFDLG